MGPHVVSLGAWCEFVPDDLSSASAGSVTFDVAEFGVLSDGRRVPLHEGERDFSVSGPRELADHPLGNLTEEGIESGVLATVLPDEDDGEQHPWQELSQLLSTHGIPATGPTSPRHATPPRPES